MAVGNEPNHTNLRGNSNRVPVSIGTGEYSITEVEPHPIDVIVELSAQVFYEITV